MSVGAVVLLLRDVPAERAPLLFASTIWSISAVAAYGHLLNDVFDLEADRRAGKPNAASGLHPAARVVALGAAAAAVLAPLLAVDYGPAGLLLIGVNVLLPTLYSLPVVRLKERGPLGVLADAAGAHVVPALFVVSVLARGDPGVLSENAALLAVLVASTAAYGVKGILAHQLVDRERDVAARVRTFLAVRNPVHVTKTLTAFALGVQLPLAAALAALLFGTAPLAALVLGLYAAIESTKWLLGWRTWLDAAGRVTAPNVPFANNFYHEVWLPFFLSLQLALSARSLAWVPAIVPLIFARGYLSAYRDLRVLARRVRAAAGGRLRRVRAT